MPIPVAYEASACRLESWLKQILHAGIGGLFGLVAIIALGSQFDSMAYIPYELLRISAHIVVLIWILILVVFLFGSTRGILRSKESGGSVVSIARWISRWSAALFLDLAIVAIALSLLLT